jgi:dihydrofolate reductase
MIAAVGARTRAIGDGKNLLWDIPTDLARFRELTRGRPVIMGSKTWESIPANRRPLPKRPNIVVSRDASYPAEGAVVVTSIEDALKAAGAVADDGDVFVIGGAQIYAMALPFADQLDLTQVEEDESATAEGKVIFPEHPGFTVIETSEPIEENGHRFHYETLVRK